ncbi:MAG: caspase family protein [Proteobacteria bacterium]|nr:caspase family protein [Pseudomonadota bacterium]
MFIIIVAALINACASVPLAPPEADTQIKNMPPPPDEALLYVYRDYQFAGCAVMFNIYIDENRVDGSLGVNNYLVVALDPGEHRFSYVATHLAPSELPSYLSEGFLPVHVNPGNKYYIGISSQHGPTRTKMVTAPPKGFANCKLIYKSRQPSTVVATKKREVLSSTAEHQQTIRSDVDTLPAATLRINKNAYAIVIGIEQYRQKLPSADYAVSDAMLVSEYLTKVMGYLEENVILLQNEYATNVDFVKYFEKWLPNNVEPGGTVFVYFSGHGAPNPKTGDAYLVPYDGDPSFIAQTGYSLKRMYAALGKLQAKEIVVALDSCFSGAGGRSVLAKGARPLVMNLQSNTVLSKNMTVLSASAGDQISSTYDDKGHGLFTYFLLKGIKNEDVVNPDGSIKMDDLFGYLAPQVERIARKQYNNEQMPQLIDAKKN